MSRICGADGCRGGWVAITEDLETGALTWQVTPSVEALATELPVLDTIAVDVHRSSRCWSTRLAAIGRRPGLAPPPPVRPDGLC